MSDRTGIEWTDATWNPIRGCSRVSEGCRHCYAEGQAARIIAMDRGRGVPEGQGSYDGLLAKAGQWNGKIKVVDEALEQPLRWQKPRMIFVNSMSDLFHENVSDKVIDRIFAVMALATQHTFQVLTKRPERMKAYLSTPNREGIVKGAAWELLGHMPKRSNAGMKPAFPLPNVWMGVSVEDQTAADERIPLLLQTPAAVRWISAEPLLGAVDLSDWLEVGSLESELGLSNPGIDWVVVGGESGHKARPMHPSWARWLRGQCAAAGVPFLFKQWGEWAPGENVARRSGVVPAARLINDAWQFGADNLAGEGGHIDDEPDLYRIGKRAAGRLLDGIQHDGYPVVSHV